MVAAVFDSVQMWRWWTTEAVYEDDKEAGRRRCNNRIEVTMAAGHWHGCDGWCHLMVSMMDNNKMKTKTGGRQRHNNQPTTGAAKAGSGWWWDRLQASVEDWWQKRPATKALTVARQCGMTKVGSSGRQQCNNQHPSSFCACMPLQNENTPHTQKKTNDKDPTLAATTAPYDHLPMSPQPWNYANLYLYAPMSCSY